MTDTDPPSRPAVSRRPAPEAVPAASPRPAARPAAALPALDQMYAYYDAA